MLAAMVLRCYGIETVVFLREGEGDPRAALTRAIGANYVSAGHRLLEHLSEHLGRLDVIFEALGVLAVAFGTLPASPPRAPSS